MQRSGKAALDLRTHRRRIDERGREQDEERNDQPQRPRPEEDEFFQPLPIVRRRRAQRYWTLVLRVRGESCNCYPIGPWSNFPAGAAALGWLHLQGRPQ